MPFGHLPGLGREVEEIRPIERVFFWCLRFLEKCGWLGILDEMPREMLSVLYGVCFKHVGE